MADSKGVLIRATKDQIIEFKESLLWKDIKRELGMWKRQFEKEVLDVVDEATGGNKDTASTLTHLGSIHGRVAAVDYFMSLPDVFLQIKEDEEYARRNEAGESEDSI